MFVHKQRSVPRTVHPESDRPGEGGFQVDLQGYLGYMTNDTTTPITPDPDPDNAADDELAAERAGQSSTVEEAMDSATDEEGHVEESAYTPTPGLQVEPGAKEDESR